MALGAYLHGAVREVSHSAYDEAERAYVQVVQWQPSFRGGSQALERARHGTHSPPGHGAVYVIAFTGQGPHKVESVEEPTTTALFVADRILSHVGKYSLPPTVAPIKVPRIAVRPSSVTTVAVAVDGQAAGRTEPITDVSRMAIQTHEATFADVVARAVARRTVKKGAIYAVKTRLQPNHWANLALDLTGVAWEASESADTRCWGLLPDKIQILRLELPAGRRILTLQPVLVPYAGPAADLVTVPVEDGRSTFVMAYYPGRQRTGRVLVSDPY